MRGNFTCTEVFKGKKEKLREGPIHPTEGGNGKASWAFSTTWTYSGTLALLTLLSFKTPAVRPQYFREGKRININEKSVVTSEMKMSQRKGQ